ncbi:EF-hand domain-containing protein [Rhodobacteraceae bacterium D3-12]|nr:EF-hand domain-containing protein [Rhodobacteraceae bacterium D3-12]
MKKAIVLLGASALVASFAVAAVAATPEDVDGNGVFSMEEMVAAYPGLTEDQFLEIDLDESGDIDEGELIAAIEEGVLEE